jgi:signal transduction histidine kinase/CheY-like chemotaxis protein
MVQGNTTAEFSLTDTIPRRRVDDRARERSREKIAEFSSTADLESPEAMQTLVHQLQVHQIELEMQNEELRRTQWELETARLRYFDLYDLAPVGYFTLSEEGLILEANLMAATLFDCSRGELVKQRISNFILKADQDIYYLHRKQLLDTGTPQSFELHILNNSDTPCWVNVTATYEKDLNGIALMRVIMTDISASKLIDTERSRTDHILHNYTCDLERATTIAETATIAAETASAIAEAATIKAEKASAIAEKANLAKSDFLSSMSHELRTPLSAILGFAQLIETGTPPPTEKQKRNLDQILRAGWYLLDLINEILDLALIESGKLSLSLEPVVLTDVLRDCQTLIEPQAEKQSININFLEIDTPHVVHADRTRLKQILINLLSNAIKYNKPAGSVTVQCMAQPLERIRICVTDTGEGLAAEKIAQLFQPFNRLGQENNAVEGTGIGLVMTKRLIELMGGEIGLESTIGEGSTFWVEMHLTTQSPTACVETKTLKHKSEKPHTAMHTLLYVEDNPANLMLIEDIIARRSDIRLLTALDGISGVALARTTQPDVILMDINLPGISGIQALKILAADPSTAHIPIIALSANAIPSDIEKGLQAGFFRYLTKPIKINEFMTTLDIALEHTPTN